jgi:hypothetical protein
MDEKVRDENEKCALITGVPDQAHKDGIPGWMRRSGAPHFRRKGRGWNKKCDLPQGHPTRHTRMDERR